jgi:homogentisate phytyltransferase/homogentisate geranylgeranyltransferase
VQASRAFYRFSRPHTIVATTVQVFSMFVLAGAGSTQLATPAAAFLLLLALVASLSLNVYIVGINQITDVDIDRLNKPYLPLASGEYSAHQGWGIVLVAALVALLIALWQPPFLTLTVGIGFLIGTIYSLPPLRFKERALWAALSIAFVRGVVTTVGLYLFFRQGLGLSIQLPLLISSAAAFFFGFGLVIALYKDIPDLEGDRRYTVRTFTVRLGPQRVFALGRWLLSAFYLFPIVYLVLQLPELAAGAFLVAHLLVLALFWRNSFRIDPSKPPQMARFYLGLWTIFYLEYGLLVGYQTVSQVVP